MVNRQFGLLQLCDDISLYVNMNAPGVPKDQEHPWFKEGFDMSIDGEKVMASWASEHEIRLRPFLFEQAWSASVKWKYVLKAKIDQQGVAKAFDGAAWTDQTVTFVP